MTQRGRRIVGWIAVGISAAIGSFWAFWGAIENFHEGWFYPSLLMNLGLMLAQYLLPMLLFMGLSLAALLWPRTASLLFLAGAAAAAWFFRGRPSATVLPLVAVPLVLLAAAHGYGRPAPRKRAIALLIGLPLATALASGIEPAFRVARRFDDGNLGARRIAAGDDDLVWAPAGPGWPQKGVSWEEASQRCRYLNADGTALEKTSRDIWRLPTVEEAVAAQHRHGRNCGGRWDASVGKPAYTTRPDKESPLWDAHSPVIYWWTATEAKGGKAYALAYNGNVWPRAKTARMGSLAFRAVKKP